MNIEEGKFYKTRDGKTVGPMRRGVPGDGEKYWISDDSLGLYVSAWFEDGSFWPAGHACKNANNAKLDLILPAYPEQGTLKEIGAQVGDVVEWMGTRGRDRDFVSYKIVSNNLGGWMAESEYGNKQLISDDPWRIISRASDTPASPVRTVTTTRQEIVPGVYGAVKVHNPGSVFVRINIDAAMSAADLTAAIKTLTEIRDALN